MPSRRGFLAGASGAAALGLAGCTGALGNAASSNASLASVSVERSTNGMGYLPMGALTAEPLQSPPELESSRRVDLGSIPPLARAQFEIMAMHGTYWRPREGDPWPPVHDYWTKTHEFQPFVEYGGRYFAPGVRVSDYAPTRYSDEWEDSLGVSAGSPDQETLRIEVTNEAAEPVRLRYPGVSPFGVLAATAGDETVALQNDAYERSDAVEMTGDGPLMTASVRATILLDGGESVSARYGVPDGIDPGEYDVYLPLQTSPLGDDGLPRFRCHAVRLTIE